jgi:uncharacterized protein
MKERIGKFISKQTCANVCCVDEKGNPFCFSCFYSYDNDKVFLFYKSGRDTRHSEILLRNCLVAGTILPDKLNLLKIKGVQFEGIVLPLNHPLANEASSHYYKKHPVAITMPGEIWTIQINKIKFTDNTLGFGTKINWER